MQTRLTGAVLVTGAGGFIGSHLVARLVAHGHRVRAFCRYNSRADRGALEWLPRDLLREVEVVFGDLRDSESVGAAATDAGTVFHLGAQVAIPYSYVNPRDFVETNLTGTLNVSEAARRTGVARIVHVSSSEVYGSAQRVPIAEDHPLEPQSPYAATKLGAEKLARAFGLSFGVPTTIVRPFNTYGPHQSARALLPTVVAQALISDELRLGAVDTRRDLTYVADTVAGLLAAAATPAAAGRTIQFGTGTDVSGTELVDLVGEALGRPLRIVRDEARLRPPDSEVRRLVSDPSLAHELLGWRAQVGLREGIEQTIGWVRSGLGRLRPEEYAV